jgi:predicted nucleic acid-binding protein
MIIISDTTPLRYLIEIEEIDSLTGLFGQVIIPERVFSELQGAKTPPQVVAWVQSRPEWLAVKQADTSLFTPQKKIQAGEHEAIALAIEMKADYLLIDDADAIKEAHRIKLPTLRLFTILELAAARNLLDFPEAVAKMRHTSFHMPPAELIAEALARDRQRKEGRNG